MKKLETSRRKFLGQSGSLALTLPLAAAIPVAVEEVASPTKVEAASEQDVRQPIPNRVLPSRAIGTASVIVSGLDTTEQLDCSGAIQTAIDSLGSNGGTVIIPWQKTAGKNRCIYMIDPQANVVVSGSTSYGIRLNSNVRLQFKPGVKLQAMTINRDPSKITNRAYMMYGVGVHDVEIANGWLVGERYTHVYSGLSTGTDEWCHGIQLLGVTGVTIRGTMVSDCTGDGICIGSNSGAAPSDVVLCDVVSTGNRRQGLSITAGDSISVYDSEFSYTSGTAPGDGIDIEPQGTDNVSNVTIDNCVLRGNASDGIQLYAVGTSITNVNILNCLFTYNDWDGIATQVGTNGVIDTGTVYGNAFFQNGHYGVELGSGTANYTVGGPGQNGTWSNNFGNNRIQPNSAAINYPNLTQKDTNGYVVGTDILLGGSGNVVQWNSYFTK
ncbi:right-handed parallel beta-helix repeat-containing protein [Terriglobus albidus]|uniref:right-handed parallel beta-helix repeat-containing protein n=1 Tax=Terriglobus albidus TaxID=1592106 RepID=UPI0021DF8812|nr:right-handed parallel beta-helix repeat-containing protein [Terriglobus albidus]